MPAEGKLKNDNILMVLRTVGRVLQIQSHELLFSTCNPLLVHVENSLVVGVGHLDGLLAVDDDRHSAAEIPFCIHGDYAWKKRVEKTTRKQGRIGE